LDGGRAGRSRAAHLGDGDVGADAEQRVQHASLCVLQARGDGGHGDDQSDPDRQAQRDEAGVAHPVV
jgi:hypothetical protein